MSETLRVGVVGASGYTGGELLRLLLGHPRVEVALATSDRLSGKPVARAHPHLRGRTTLRFSGHDAAQGANLDALFTAVPHGESAPRMQWWLKSAPRVYDLSADFRLRDARAYRRWYGQDHAAPELLGEAAYGVAELHRAEYADARLVAGAGCIATAATLALHPLAAEGLIEGPVVVDAKIGSSAAGADANASTHHPERSGVVRPYAPTRHRHAAEVAQETGLDVRLSAHAVELVRGVLATCHATLREPVEARELWRAYRRHYGDEPFVRVVAERTGLHRYPEPRLLAGTNHCDVGFEVEEGTDRVVVMAALDNLVKGAAGAAVQNMNIAHDWPEALGLEFAGLHPL